MRKRKYSGVKETSSVKRIEPEVKRSDSGTVCHVLTVHRERERGRERRGAKRKNKRDGNADRTKEQNSVEGRKQKGKGRITSNK